MMAEAWRGQVEKAVVSEKDSETQCAEHVDEPALGMGIAAFMMTEPLKDADHGTFDQPMKKKPKLFETDSGKLEKKKSFIKSERKQSYIKSVGKPCVPIENSTQICKGKSLQLKPESTGEENYEDPKTQHLEGANKPGPVDAHMLKVATDPVYARYMRCLNPDYARPKVLDPEVARRRAEGNLLLRSLPLREGEKEARIQVYTQKPDLLDDPSLKNIWGPLGPSLASDDCFLSVSDDCFLYI